MTQQVKLIILAIIVLCGLIVILKNYLKPIRRLERKLKRLKKFPDSAKYRSFGDILTVTWSLGHKNSPENVHVYKFDLKEKKCRHYINTGTSTDEIFEKTIEQYFR